MQGSLGVSAVDVPGRSVSGGSDHPGRPAVRRAGTSGGRAPRRAYRTHVTEIADLRLAVDEACGLLVPSSALKGEVCCLFIQDQRGLRVRFSASDSGQGHPDTRGFGWRVLSALVDELGWSCDGGRVRVDILKRPLERDVY
jgi:hypothetical protein